MLDKTPLIRRPIRATLISFTCMMAYFAVCVLLFANDPPDDAFAQPIWILFVPIYGACLSVFVTGLVLAMPSRYVDLLVYSVLIHAGCLLGFWLLLRNDPDAFIRMMPGIAIAMMALTIAWGAAALALSAMGWINFYRRRRAYKQGPHEVVS